MSGSVFLRGGRVELRSFEEDDLGLLAPVYGDPVVRQRMGFHGPYTERHEREWLESLDESNLGLFLRARDGDTDPTDLGLLTLYDVDEQAGTAEMGAVLLPDARGSGYATPGCSLLLDHAFDERRLHRVRATTRSVNGPARATLETLGFTHEGTAREAAVYRGGRVDELHYGLLASEWRGGDTTGEG